MMTQSSSSDSATQIAEPATASAAAVDAVNNAEGGAKTSRPSRPPPPVCQQQSHTYNDVLLNIFQIKKKRYRVLLNGDQLVWERFETKRAGNSKCTSGASGVAATAAASKKETEYETEQLANKAAYGSSSKVLHINEIIRVERSVSAKLPIYTVQVADEPTQALPTTVAAAPIEQYLTVHYAQRIVKSRTDCNRWHVCQLQLYNTDAYIVRQWHTQLSLLLARSLRCRVRRLLVFVNPYGGRQQALHRYERHCKPLFQLAGIDASCIISQRANQIRDILMTHDLQPYDAVCCVGGDGTVAEVINGLLLRTMCDLGLDTRRPAYVPKPRLPVGIIPAGSTDTVAYSLHGTEDARTAAIHMVLGQLRGLDICSVRNGRGIVRFCASVMSYGYLGDVAAKSERYRWMGTKRYEYTGAKAFLLNRGYEAEIRLMPLTENVMNTEAVVSETPCYANCQRCSAAQITTGPAEHRQRIVLSDEKEPSGSTVVDQRDGTYSKVGPVDGKQGDMREEIERNANVNDLSETNCDSSQLSAAKDEEEKEEDDERCKLIKGKFFMISGANITCACSRSPNGISRYNHLGDGCLELILVRSTTLWNNLRLLINTMGHSGDIRNLPFVEVYRTQRFVFRTPHANNGDDCSIRGSSQPIVGSAATSTLSTDDDTISSWNCDGEVVTDLEIVMSSHCQLINVFMRGPHAYSEALKRNDGRCFQSCCCNNDD